MAKPALTARPVSADTVRGTRIAVETNAEILAKKLVHRVAVYHIFLPRDLYDIAVAQRFDPDALEAAFSILPSEQLHDLCEQLGTLGRDWARDHREPLLQPAYPKDARNAPAIVRRLIRRHLDDRATPGTGSDPLPARAT